MTPAQQAIVEAEHRDDRPGPSERCLQRWMVVDAQVARQPEQRGHRRSKPRALTASSTNAGARESALPSLLFPGGCSVCLSRSIASTMRPAHSSGSIHCQPDGSVWPRSRLGGAVEHLRVDAAGDDLERGDAGSSQLATQAVGEGGHAGLRGGVGADAGEAEVGDQARVVDDLARPALEHRGQHPAGQVGEAHQVDLEQRRTSRRRPASRADRR